MSGLSTLVGTVTPDVMAVDARAFIDFLLARPETTGGPVGTTGYRSEIRNAIADVYRAQV